MKDAAGWMSLYAACQVARLRWSREYALDQLAAWSLGIVV